MLLALLVLWPVMIFVRQRRRSLVYQPMSDEDFVLAVVGIVGALAAVFLPILIHRPVAERIMQRGGHEIPEVHSEVGRANS